MSIKIEVIEDHPRRSSISYPMMDCTYRVTVAGQVFDFRLKKHTDIDSNYKEIITAEQEITDTNQVAWNSLVNFLSQSCNDTFFSS